MTYWKTKDFQALQREWYELLEKVGFCDAEKNIGGEMQLRQSATFPFRHVKNELDRQAKESYFRLLSEKIQFTKFKNCTERVVLTLYAYGAKIKDICYILAMTDEPRERDAIRFMIRRYEVLWGIRKYSRKQLNLREDK